MSAFLVGYRNGLVKSFKYTLKVGYIVYEVVEQVGEVHYRLPEARRVACHSRNGTERHRSGGHYYQPEEEYRGAYHRRDIVGGGPYQVREAHRPHPALAVVVGEPVEYGGVLVLAGEYLRDSRAYDIFLQVGVHVRAFV